MRMVSVKRWQRLKKRALCNTESTLVSPGGNKRGRCGDYSRSETGMVVGIPTHKFLRVATEGGALGNERVAEPIYKGTRLIVCQEYRKKQETNLQRREKMGSAIWSQGKYQIAEPGEKKDRKYLKYLTTNLNN